MKLDRQASHVEGNRMSRLNLGAGNARPEGWVNADKRGEDVALVDIADARSVDWLLDDYDEFDEIVANHLLSCFSHWDLVKVVLPNILRLLRPGGVLRVLVPDARKAAMALLRDDAAHFPLGDDLPTTDERFCTFLPWFGESLSIFTPLYLSKLLYASGFTAVAYAQHHHSPLGSDSITDLDDREGHSFVMEARR